MNPNEHLSEGELLAMTSGLDQVHQDQSMPAMRSAISEWVESIRESRRGATKRAASRRTFLLGGAGLVGGAAVLAACGSSSKTTSPTTLAPPTSSSGSATGGALTGDLAVVAMAASLENLAVYAYKAGISAAQAGKLGTVPAAVVTFAETAMAQHQDHAQGWNAVLTAAGKPAVTVTDPALTPTVNSAFAKVTDASQLASLALLLENVAAQTYQSAVPALSSPSGIAVAATIQPVEMQHAAILYYVLGQYPGIQGTAANMYASGTPLAFNPVSLARPASDYTGS